jgi:hypothetical protein
MKKMVIGVMAMLMFQFCTNELNEIDGLIGSHVEGGNLTDNSVANLPTGAFLGKYFSTDNSNELVYSKIEKRIRHDFNSPIKQEVASKELGAKWSGNFKFEPGTYTFSIKSDKSITVSIDDEIVLENHEKSTEEEVVQELNGVHKVEVEYNLENNKTDTSGTDAGTSTGGTDGGTSAGGTDGGSSTGGTDGGTSTGGTDGGSSTGGTDGGTSTGGTDGGTSTGGTDGGSSTGGTDGGTSTGGTDGGSSTGGTDGGTSTGGTDGGTSTGGTDGGSSTGGTDGGTSSGGTDGGTSTGGTTDGDVVNTSNNTPTVEVVWESSETVNSEGGVFYTAEELAMWRSRAKNGPFKSKGDAFPNSPGDWDRMVKDATTFLNTSNDAMVWKGLNQSVLDYPIGESDKFIFRSSTAYYYVNMMSAALVDLVQETTTYRSKLKKVMLAQAQMPGVDFSNRTYFPTTAWTGNSDFVWTYAIWQLKFLRTYDFIGPENFTSDERAIMEQWFRNGAEWHSYLCNIKGFDKLYSKRGIATNDYLFKMNGQGDPIFRDGPYRWQAGSWHSNRRWGQVAYVAHVGVLLNDLDFKLAGSYAFKEWLSFHLYEDGYAMELFRSLPNNPQKGLGYTPSTTANAASVARILYLDGFENLFDYKTDVYLSKGGNIVQAEGLSKSLEWAILQQFRNNLLETDAPAIYPYNSSGTSNDILMHYCNANSSSSQIRHRIKPGEPSAIANIYYNNSKIRGVYWPDGSLCGYPSDPSTQGIFNAWTGTDGQYPGYMFMYAK